MDIKDIRCWGENEQDCGGFQIFWEIEGLLYCMNFIIEADGTRTIDNGGRGPGYAREVLGALADSAEKIN